MLILTYNNDIDPVLDCYNDYKRLYEMFKDEIYLKAAEGIMNQLRESK